MFCCPGYYNVSFLLTLVLQFKTSKKHQSHGKYKQKISINNPNWWIFLYKETIGATGEIRWRYSGGKMYDFETLNAADFVQNASISQSFFKGKLIARIEAFDIQLQVSNTQYTVNAHGRTETWYHYLLHYVMAHLVYHWNLFASLTCILYHLELTNIYNLHIVC